MGGVTLWEVWYVFLRRTRVGVTYPWVEYAPVGLMWSIGIRALVIAKLVLCLCAHPWWFGGGWSVIIVMCIDIWRWVGFIWTGGCAGCSCCFVELGNSVWVPYVYMVVSVDG